MSGPAAGARPGVGRVRAVIRSVVVVTVLLVTTFGYGVRILVGSLLGEGRMLCTCRRIAHRWGRSALWAAGVRVRVVGEERLTAGGPRVVVSNHQSWFDIFALAAVLPELPRFVGKEELNRIPVFGRAWLACGQISINRSDQAEAFAALEKAGRFIREDAATVVMFPEGTRSRDGRLQPFKKGAFVLAIQSEVPVLPVFVVGSGEIMGKGSALVRPGTIEIRVGEPIPTRGMGHEDRDRLRRRAWDAVAGLGGEAAVPGDGAGGRDLPASGEEDGGRPEAGS